MHNPILLTAICAVVSFFIGAIPFGLILGRVFNHTDIRKAGSGNIGTTNALRVAGPKVAALTLLLDCLKGAICVLIARPLIASVGYGFPVSIMAPGAPGDWMLGVICLAAVWGHIFSPYLNFHGGKGIAVGLGVMAPWAQYLRISALTGRSVEKIWAMVDAAERRARKRSPPRASTPSSPTCASSVTPWWTASAACACTT